jgi:hypothetical protein
MEMDRSTATALEKRVAHLRKAFARGLGRKASVLEATAILRAAKLTAFAEFATSAPGVSLTDLVRLDHAAERARAAMARTLAKARDRVPSLEELGLAV